MPVQGSNSEGFVCLMYRVTIRDSLPWPGFLYCLKYLGFDFVFMCSPISVGHQFLMFSKRSRGTLNQSNIEVLVRTCPGKMASMVILSACPGLNITIPTPARHQITSSYNILLSGHTNLTSNN